jgi:hypothetical protein
VDAQTRELNLSWIPASGFQLRKAGVYFDAVRVDDEEGRALADRLELLTGGEPGPIVLEANGRRGVYFLCPPGSTAGRAWPREAECFNSTPSRVSYVPVPALQGRTWPLSWRCTPLESGRFVHPMLLCATAATMFEGWGHSGE